MIFRVGDKEYRGATALEVVRALQREEAGVGPESQTLRGFLLFSLSRLGDRVPPRELDVSPRLVDETLALSYLYLRDEYGAGELLDVDDREFTAHALSS
ncbi:MAG: hypothetical protein LC672_00740 [Acidobacteria bacterium]|nr:hypothetical protein [Acidobacteriota bacterium]